MKLHPTNVTATSGEMLGVQIMQMRYDKVLEVFNGMLKEAQDQAFGDRLAKRLKLSVELEELAFNLSNAANSVSYAVDLCQPYIDAEKSFLESKS